MKPDPKPVKVQDKKYRRHMKTLDCTVDGCLDKPDTVVGHHLYSRLRDDQMIPLCHPHHNGSNDSIHNLNRERFKEICDKDLDFEAEKLYKEWLNK